MWDVGKPIEVDIRFNNAAVYSQCALCKIGFKPPADFIPFIHNTWDLICDDCQGSYNFEILCVETECGLAPVQELDWQPSLKRCWRCGKDVFEKAYELCFPCNELLDEEFYKGEIPRD
jgi:hypothetical protein